MFYFSLPVFPASRFSAVFSFPPRCQIVVAGVSVFAPHVPWPCVLCSPAWEPRVSSWFVLFSGYVFLFILLDFPPPVFSVVVCSFRSLDFDFWTTARIIKALCLFLYLPVIVFALGLSFSSHNTSWPSAVIFAVRSSKGFWPRRKWYEATQQSAFVTGSLMLMLVWCVSGPKFSLF